MSKIRTQYARLLMREEMGWLPTCNTSRTLEWTPEYTAHVALTMCHPASCGALLLKDFGFPLSVALAVLTGRMVDLML